MAEVSATLDLADRTREADQPHSPVVRFPVNKPLRLDAGIDFSPLQIAYQTYGTLNDERSNAVLVCHALTGDQHVVNRHPVTGKPGWWETMVGPGRPIDTERYFVICPNVVGGCMGSSGPASTNPATGMPWGLDFPVITVRDMVRAQAMLLDHLGIDFVVRGRRRLARRHAGAAMGGELSGARIRGAADRGGDATFGAEHRLPRGRPSGGDGRSRLARRALFRRGHQSAARARGRAHGRAHYLSVGRGAASQIRPPLPGPRQSDVLLRCRFPGRILSAPSGLQLRRALRRQFLSLSDARDGLFRSRRRLRRRGGESVSRHADAFLRHLVHQRLAVPDVGIARHRACAQRRRRARIVRRDHHRQGSRRFPARRAGIVHHRQRFP